MRLKFLLISTLLISLTFGYSPFQANAQTSSSASPEDIQARIDAREADIAALDKAIEEYQQQLRQLSTKGSSLAKTVAELDLTQKKLAASIKLTESKISTKNLEIQSLSRRIRGAEETIDDNRLYMTELIKKINEEGSHNIAELILSGRSVSDAWNTIQSLAELENDVQEHVQTIKRTRNQLETNKTATERAKADLVKLQSQLTDERKVVVQTTSQQKKLLADTKNSEASYQRLLREQQALKEAFEREILEFESALEFALDPSKLPKVGSSILSWPLDRVLITQHFGDTAFSRANTQVYNGKGHNGIDLAASIGTPVKASASGIVVGTGNTDLIRGCYSLGKWILVKHGNGLSTLYAHLSVHSVGPGAQVGNGQIIGYSGNTGYSTGPHLHFGVYASPGIEIKQFSSSRTCRGAVLPIAALAAYLNPLSYLPTR